MKSLAYFALFLATVTVISTQTTPGDIACGASATANAFVPNPDDCTQFYLCSGANDADPDFPLYCGDEYKCFAETECSEDTAACIAACAANGPSCNTKCAAPGDQIYDPSDCNKHYICDSNSKPVEIHCFEDRPFFNGLECVADETQCCTCRKQTCTAAGELIVNERDCHSFYTCAGDPAIPVGPTPCPDGGVFDPDTSKCDSNNKECDNSCNIGGGGDITSSTQSSITSDVPTSASSLSTFASSPSTLPSSTPPTTLTSTSTPTSTSTSTPTTTPHCLDSSDFTCPEEGFYPRCPFCDPSYFSCHGVGGSPTLGECAGILVFNPTPEYPFCVRPENCPLS